MDREEVDIVSFMSADKSMIVAPAGHGKTHTIVDCLEHYEYKYKKILILTHTHAGIASIKEKISSRNISSTIYDINTICSFTLNLTSAYIPESRLPDDSDMHHKYGKALEFANRLLLAKPIRSVLEAKYEHVIVDEYQDCDIIQHQLISRLGEIIKIHILGDAMQGIFGFNGIPVNLNSSEFDVYRDNQQTLNTPWRWINAGCPELGDEILQIRCLLDNKQDIDLRQYKHIEFIETRINDLYWHSKSKFDTPPEIIQVLRHFLSDKYKGNLLVIHPQTYQKDSRIKLTKNLYNLGMLESIDDSDFYNTVNAFENKTGEELIAAIIDFLRNTCISSSLVDWFHSDGSLVAVKKEEKQPINRALSEIINSLISQKSYSLISSGLSQISKLLNLKVARKDVYYTIQRILMDADHRNITLSGALKLNRDKVRRIGRNIKGKYIGTTLLTKGLECDTVIVLNAHEFPDERHLYVALSRCSKRLIVASEKAILSPYPKQNKKRKQTDAIQLSLFPELEIEQ